MENKQIIPQIKSRDIYWQQIRGVCIICVILIHSRFDFNGTYLISWSYNYGIILRQIINFPVAIFIFLAGYFTNIEKNKKLCLVQLRYRLKKLILPFIIWSSFYSFAICIYRGEKIGLELIKTILLGKSVEPLYFIIVLLQLIIITPLTIRSIKSYRKISMILLLFITPIYLLFLNIFSIIYKVQFLYEHYFFSAWFIFYYFGLWTKIKGYNYFLKRNAISISIFLCISGIGISILEGYWKLHIGLPGSLAISQIKISTFLYIFAIINLLFHIKLNYKKFKSSLLKKIGDVSYGIYYVHIFWIMISNIIIKYMPFIKDILPIAQVFQLIFSLSLSYLSISITKKIIGHKPANEFLGF
jgi:membrane-bound acyltransferase YfiQ involved in biofilm formation